MCAGATICAGGHWIDRRVVLRGSTPVSVSAASPDSVGQTGAAAAAAAAGATAPAGAAAELRGGSVLREESVLRDESVLRPVPFEIRREKKLEGSLSAGGSLVASSLSPLV